MKLKSNGMLKILVPSVIAVAVFVGIKGFKSTPEEIAKPADPNAYIVNNVTPEELRELNIQGDTAEDTVKTLLGETKDTKRTVHAANQRIEDVLRENKKLRLHNDSVDERINEALAKQSDEMMSQFENEISKIVSRYEEKLDQLAQTQSGASTTQGSQSTAGENLPIGGGQNALSEQTIWVLPDDMQAVDKDGKPVTDGQQGEGFSFAKVFSRLDDSFIGKAHSDFVNKQSATSPVEKKNPSIPVYTLPENSTLIGSVAMTALIGRIPLNGQLTDAYPFKILIGRENLTANGIDLPDVEGAVISGRASGDWTLSCVRGSVNSMTFVFNDGRTHTVSNSKNSGSNNSGDASANTSNAEGIGWISDPHGIPCVPGKRKTNAAQFLAGQFLLSGGAAAAQGLSRGQTTTVVDGNSVIGAVTGNQGKFILGQALGGGLNETTEWFRQRYGQTFDAVYVPPGHQVAVHLTKSIDINYDPTGRKVKYFAPIGKQGMD
ncbi:TIGR03752 family integrating conjugative element protein [Aggregatibacter actinomycetemcomitans]|uniref:TIGR03752 family integrating conjugative element protein n=1 Tax=Aggregatibacter actinomycetemcomitans TaxID=714 RepID=UPI00024003FF|nr:TIGR03752 family integrating conjugative element protein [Aggregatibacter actinomycetemcomitans]EHK90249.1 integrating conjugative element protein [Aggregatibacter actinomycetemcomitans RhAA1]KNE77317.1 integrating conjugative element protein [Aggregatibacter actinomycetemcomitans RhAA1]MBN6079270.1 TIGR03752 family integrating conjugative element protein [Aggregatibacter actinomycetemcomitans]